MKMSGISILSDGIKGRRGIDVLVVVFFGVVFLPCFLAEVAMNFKCAHAERKMQNVQFTCVW